MEHKQGDKSIDNNSTTDWTSVSSAGRISHRVLRPRSERRRAGDGRFCLVPFCLVLLNQSKRLLVFTVDAQERMRICSDSLNLVFLFNSVQLETVVSSDVRCLQSDFTKFTFKPPHQKLKLFFWPSGCLVPVDIYYPLFSLFKCDFQPI